MVSTFIYRSTPLGVDNKFRHYDHLAGLWEHEEWLPEAAVQLARTHYAGYAVKRADGLRIISLNTNLCESHLCCL